MGRVAILSALAALLIGAPAASAAPSLHARSGGFLTARSDERPRTIALDYVRGHPGTIGLDSDDLAGLRLTRAYRSGGGTVHLLWEQHYRGIPVFGGGLRANVDAQGRLINVGGARSDPKVASTHPDIPAPRGEDARLTIFRDRLAWRVLQREDPTHVYDTVVDARNGDTLYRVNLVREATASTFDNYPGAPLGGTQTTKTLPGGWLSDATRLFGANAHVYSDDDDDIDGVGSDPSPVAGDEIPPSSGTDWLYPQTTQAASGSQHCPAAGCSWNNFDGSLSWTVNRAQAGTQLFYYVNTFHDHLRDAAGIGFGASSNNFEGADRVIAQVDDGAATDSGMFPNCDHTNNAFVMPVPEGTPLMMQIYLWSSFCPPFGLLNDVNAADDALIVYHEYTHGMTNRLVTDAAGFPGLNGAQPGAMDEGFADWYAIDMLNGQGLEPDTSAPGEIAAGKYENDRLRTQPFDCPVGASAAACPGSPTAGSGGYTYGDFGRVLAGAEVHADGEIWVETLWDLRRRMIADHGALPGIARTRALITDGMRLAPVNPTFLDMRNAILQADTARGFGDAGRIWSVFAARGMGYRASADGSNDVSPVQDFSLPPTPLPPPPAPNPDLTRPAVSRASMSRRRFRVGQGTTFSFRLSEASTAAIVIDRPQPGRRVRGRCRPAKRSLRHRPRCTRYVGVGRIERLNLRRGTHRVRFSGRLRSRGLRVGAYRASIVATDPAGNRSRPVRLTFRVVRG